MFGYREAQRDIDSLSKPRYLSTGRPCRGYMANTASAESRYLTVNKVSAGAALKI